MSGYNALAEQMGVGPDDYDDPPQAPAIEDGAVVWIPLRAKDGSVKAYTQIDASDAATVIGYRWSLDSVGYVRRRVEGGRTDRLHRILLGLTFGDKRQADHLNRDKLDNRRANLRIATPAENSQNRPAVATGRGTSRFRNVNKGPGGRGWQVYVKIANRNRYIGTYPTEAIAGRVAAEFRAEHMPGSDEYRAKQSEANSA